LAYRGFGIQYKIRKTTINNKTGDSYAITIPRIFAEQFQDCYFKLSVSGMSLTFTSGCKLTQEDILYQNDFDRQTKMYSGNKPVMFR